MNYQQKAVGKLKVCLFVVGYLIVTLSLVLLQFIRGNVEVWTAFKIIGFYLASMGIVIYQVFKIDQMMVRGREK